MTAPSAIILGIIQGLTEFLPVSSSGHLVIFQKLMPGFSQPGVMFDVILHLGTTLAVIYYFREKLLKIKFNYLVLLAVGTIPAVIAGLLFRKSLEGLFNKDGFLGVEFIITGALNFLVDLKPSKKSILDLKNSFFIGIAQAFAIIPAISRSGITIFTGTQLGIDKSQVAEFSFLMSIPAIIGANVLEIMSHGLEGNGVSGTSYFAGFLTSFIIGFLSIGVLLKFLRESKFKYFGYYTIVLGILVVFFLK